MRRLILILPIIIAAACSSPKTPLIGITCSRSDTGATLLATTYTEAVGKAGGVPVVIPTVSSPAEAEALLAKVDGIIFSGGEDVTPAWFGEDVLNETVETDPIRDRSDSLLARAALASGKPVLAICRGAQLMNVVLGGSLFQDIPSQVPETVGHSGGSVHKIGIMEGSVLAQLFGTDSLEVNSFHHQGIKDPAPGIRITARSADGLVEAYEADRVLAVQFHPEKMLRNGDERWIPFFKFFVDRCRRG